MPIPKLDEFLSDPKHKEESDFLRGVIDARVKEIAADYEKERKKKKKQDADPDDGSSGESGSFFDAFFGGAK